MVCLLSVMYQSGILWSKTNTCNDEGMHSYVKYTTLPTSNWNFQEAQIETTVTPPFWLTGWFKTIVIALILGLLTFLYKRRTHALERQRKILERMVEKQTMELKQKNLDLEKEHQKLKDAQVQLVQSEKMAGLGTLAAGMAHEINNPTNFTHTGIYNMEQDLNKLKSFLLELASDDADHEILIALDEKFEDLFASLSIMREGTTRIRDIVKDLNTFSRMDEAVFKEVNLLEGLETTCNLVKVNYRKVKFVYDFQANPIIQCLPAQLNQVYMNLMVNGCQAILKKQNTGTLTLQTTEKNGYAVIGFKDTGIGMSEEVRRNMFVPFFTAKDVGEGTGLGLSISYGIVKKHGGRFEVESTEGLGSEILLYLPIKQP